MVTKMYQKAIVTFIDILGFSELVKKSKAETINKALDIVEKYTSPIVIDDEVEKDDIAEVISFSDSVIRIRKIETEKNKQYPGGILFQELISMVHAQGELIDFDIVVRGGITVGDIYIAGGRVFGPGLISAYELESKFALHPRIIIDPYLIQEHKKNQFLKAEWHSVNDEHEIFGRMLRQGDDGVWFIDYARALEGELDEHETYPIFLRRHKEVILKGATMHSKLNSILRKYVWMAFYHNQIVNNLKVKVLKDYGFKKSDLIITSDEIPALQYLRP